MKETRADTRWALLQALGLHLLLLGLMFAGLQWTRHSAPPSAQGEPIQADIVQVSALSNSMQRALKRTAKVLVEPKPTPPTAVPPEPMPEPAVEAPPQPKQLPPPVPEPAPVEQEKVQRDANSMEVAKQKREQEAKRRQAEQVELAARKQRELAQQKQQQLEMLRKLREHATRERQLAEQRARQQTDVASAAPARPGNRGTDTGLGAQYAAALQQAILRQWTRPETVALGQECKITIKQIPGGEVVDVQISFGCPYDALGRRSVEAAVLKASPLPYVGYEAVFRRTLELNFKAADR